MRQASKSAVKANADPSSSNTKPKRKAASANDVWELRLYVAGQSPRSLAALTNLQRVCAEYLDGKYHIEVIDLLVDPKLAAGDQILAVPTLVRKLPEPVRKIIGDLSNTDRVLVGSREE